MTNAFGNVDVASVPRVYGASELGVLSITAPGEVHPRVEYVGGEVFVGLDDVPGGPAITQGQAETWKRPFAEAVADAVSRAGALPEPVDGAILVQDEAVAASVLTEPDRVEGAGVSGAPVVFAFARDRLLIVGSDDEAAVTRALDLAEELYEAGGPLVSAHPIVLADGKWAPFPWRERFPSLELRFERMLRLFSVRAYEAQSVALQRPDVHLADPKIHVREDGVTLTFAAWPKGTATLLPVVDNVMVADPAGSLSVATMNEFLDAGGDAIVRTGLSPLRYFVPGAPPA
ncbi:MULTISPECIES: hypothetical protein [unclassified Microbacterium]|uniref:hypothetical protein n=1 Tax=unclassified Microbacterium TaxID=2609290 RepID=UPI000EA93828|nr:MULTISPECIES: hypothetical protein [unclassified Microbacterium]MBT2484539.1 hypothetical protein [Microbacterium sp. ISL-108]RKN67440.1 hypothetical protein D7252_07500 [Microbacterium sp. CGR2]